MAAEYSARITLLHIVPPDDRRHPAASDEPDALRSAMHRMFVPQVDPRCEVKILVEAGDPAKQIPARARADKVDLIGFGVRRAGEITMHFRNSVAYQVVLGADCPVLTSHFGQSW